MVGEGVVMEAITSSNIEPLLPSRVSYAHSLSCTNDELKSFRSYLKWMSVEIQ